jgi:hypothetical protein
VNVRVNSRTEIVVGSESESESESEIDLVQKLRFHMTPMERNSRAMFR